MAIQNKNSKSTVGPTPAPVKQARTVPPGEFGNHSDEGRGTGYGRGQSAQCSSLAPGQSMSISKSSDFSIDSKGGNEVRDVIQKRGLRSDATEDSQLRAIGKHNVPTHAGAVGRTKAPAGSIKNATQNPRPVWKKP
jgi:hypothetical protein